MDTQNQNPQRSSSHIDVHQVIGSSHVTGLNLLLVGENTWHPGFKAQSIDSQGNSLVALRTIAGQGELSLNLDDGLRKYSLDPGSVILFDDQKLESYFPLADRWQTHWYDFIADEPTTLPLNQCWMISITDLEIETFGVIRSEVVSRSAARRRVACARFGLLLRGWLSATELGDWGDDDFACTERAVAIMCQRLYEPVGIDFIAKVADVSPAVLRQAFIKRIGLSPKKFYNRLRMNEAARLLREGLSVAETADKMGFSDAFHFSRAFKSYFQVAPKTKKSRKPD